MLKNYAVSGFMQIYSDVVELLHGNRTGETSRCNLPFFFTNIRRITVKRTSNYQGMQSSHHHYLLSLLSQNYRGFCV